MSKNIWIIGHWCSCNMGDRCQPYAIIYPILKNRNDNRDQYAPIQSLYFVNLYNSEDKSGMTVQIRNITHKIYGPYDDIPVADLAIMTTGSMYGDSKYVTWTKNLMETKRIKKLIIWGGFSLGNMPFNSFSKALSFLHDPNITYYARSHKDLEIYHKIVGNDKLGRLAGDPMCFWTYYNDPDYGYSFETLQGDIYGCLKPAPLSGNVVVPSTYAFDYNMSFWLNACDKADYVVCIDSSFDENIVRKYANKAIMLREPWKFTDAIKNARHVISGRLHSAVITACMNIPTTMIITDDAEPGEKSFKFDAVGNTAVGEPNGCICRVIKASYANIDIDNCFKKLPILKTSNAKKYNDLTKESIDLIYGLIRA